MIQQSRFDLSRVSPISRWAIVRGSAFSFDGFGKTIKRPSKPMPVDRPRTSDLFFFARPRRGERDTDEEPSWKTGNFFFLLSPYNHSFSVFSINITGGLIHDPIKTRTVTLNFRLFRNTNTKAQNNLPLISGFFFHIVQFFAFSQFPAVSLFLFLRFLFFFHYTRARYSSSSTTATAIVDLATIDADAVSDNPIFPLPLLLLIYHYYYYSYYYHYYY